MPGLSGFRLDHEDLQFPCPGYRWTAAGVDRGTSRLNSTSCAFGGLFRLPHVREREHVI
jgi:hypothetical protein